MIIELLLIIESEIVTLSSIMQLSKITLFFTSALSLIGSFEVEDPTRFGVLEIDQDSKVTQFIEKPKDKSYGNKISLGLYHLFKKDLLSIHKNLEIPCSFERQVFPELSNAGLLNTYTVFGDMLDVGTLESYISAHIVEGEENWVSPNNVQISESALVKNSVILDNCIIQDNVTILDSIISSNSITTTEDCAATWKHISGSNFSIFSKELSEPKSSLINLKLPVNSKFSFLPVRQLSKIRISFSLLKSCSTRWEPIKPAPPVIKIFIF